MKNIFEAPPPDLYYVLPIKAACKRIFKKSSKTADKAIVNNYRIKEFDKPNICITIIIK